MAVPSCGAEANRKVGELEAAGAGHGLRHHGRIARNMLADEAGDQPRVIVVAAAAREADVEIDGLALEERLGRLRAGARRESQQRRASRRRNTILNATRPHHPNSCTACIIGSPHSGDDPPRVNLLRRTGLPPASACDTSYDATVRRISPSPLWGGVGGGGRELGHFSATRHDPPPQPSPTRGEGVTRGRRCGHLCASVGHAFSGKCFNLLPDQAAHPSAGGNPMSDTGIMTKTRFEVVPLTKHIGAELRGIDLRQKPDDGDHPGDLSGLARSSGHHLSGAELVAGGPGAGDRLLRRDRRARPAGQVFSQGLFQAAARHHADLQHPRERRADRRAARRRDDVPSRHDPCRGPEQGDAALFGRDSLDRRQHAVRQRLCRLRHARSGGPRPARRPQGACTTTITARPRRATARAPRRSANACIRCSAPTRTPAARRSMSTG